MTKPAKTVKATPIKLTNPKDWQWVRLAAEGNEYAQARLADALGWDGDNDQLAHVREFGDDYAIVEIESDGAVYIRYKVR